LGGIFIIVSGMLGHIVAKPITVAHYQIHNTDDIFKVIGSEVKVTDRVVQQR